MSTSNFKSKILNDLKKFSDATFAKHNYKFFKAFKSGYGEGDKFWGIKVPQIRLVSEKYWKNISLKETEILLQNEIHEVRLSAIFILIKKYKSAEKQKPPIMKTYIRNSKHINNWDLVDLSAPNIAGEFWYSNNLKIFWQFAKSCDLWKERIAMVSTLYFIKKDKFEETIELAKLFLTHKHDLIHKATGWMLREVGKKNLKVLTTFLNKYSKSMPRTMLRYSIEKLSVNEKKLYMKK
ncbi:MAG: DNA alkylation repair protein [Elusimicrobiota bacterium]|jgi:3-methyladenine DNA glycosylase AlkD|nr:DNA alkylation repair protein [Elusimicrobiota bacterium]